MVIVENKQEKQVNLDINIDTKQCIKCNIVKSTTDFYTKSNTCKPCKIASRKCAHGKYKYYCRECSTSGYCIHGKDKRFCREGCDGSIICEHSVKFYSCKICNSKIVCEHKVCKTNCKICSPEIVCEHGINRDNCKICNPSTVCIHGISKKYCKIDGCGGRALCKHKINKRYCGECGGTGLCIHNKVKTRCIDCGGSEVCEHQKLRYYCIICRPEISCQLCKNVYVSKSTRCYPLCQACFSFANPGSELVTAYKVKERYLTDELTKRLEDIPIQLTFDKIVEGGCSKRRPDVLIDCLTHSIVIECDENQHKNYECENKRTMEIFQDLGNRPLVLVRFNPDSYLRLDGSRQKSCFTPLVDIEDIHKKKFYNLVEDEWTRRIDILEPIIKQYLDLNTFPTKEITVITLFYDNFG